MTDDDGQARAGHDDCDMGHAHRSTRHHRCCAVLLMAVLQAPLFAPFPKETRSGCFYLWDC